jgi:D-tyrosyl-tRNA(Tyr) deacylase
LIALLQRVAEASVSVEGQCIGRIARGLLVLLCAERGDSEKEADALLHKLLGYRVFADADGKMNRPSFTPAAPPAEASRLFDYALSRACAVHSPVEAGRFGADMQVALVNDGPVTFWLQVSPASVAGALC